MTIAKLGTNDRENEMLYKARLNNFAIDPRSFLFPSAESSYKKGLKLIEQYKAQLDKGTAVYNCRTDDLYASFDLVIGEDLLGYALGLLQNTQEQPFYTLDNRIYEVQGIVLVVRDFINALYQLYPEIREKGNAENMAAAMDYMNRICNYDPMYITSKLNSGELIISYEMCIRDSPRSSRARRRRNKMGGEGKSLSSERDSSSLFPDVRWKRGEGLPLRAERMGRNGRL